MKIGIDLDGVVIDSVTTFRTYEEIFDLDKLNGNNLINREEPKFQARYKWKDEEQEEIDLMIDDDYKIIEKLSNNNIKTLYFRDTGLKKLEENEYIKEVNNWGDIYRYIKSLI